MVCPPGCFFRTENGVEGDENQYERNVSNTSLMASLCMSDVCGYGVRIILTAGSMIKMAKNKK